MEFGARENTDLLWKTLYDSGKFTGYTKEKLQLAYSLFDKTVTGYTNREGHSLLEQNKAFITVYLSKLNESNPTFGDSLYKQEDISNKRIAELDSLYHEKTNEFNSFSPAPPKKIDFSDSSETTLEPLLREILSNQKLILSYMSVNNQNELETDLISLT